MGRFDAVFVLYLLSCRRCGALFGLCSSCYRGQVYCSPNCRRSARAVSHAVASRRDQATMSGRLNHARRQGAYRERELVRHLEEVSEKVTDHPSPTGVEFPTLTESDQAGTGEAVTLLRDSNPLSRGVVACIVCGRRGPVTDLTGGNSDRSRDGRAHTPSALRRALAGGDHRVRTGPASRDGEGGAAARNQDIARGTTEAGRSLRGVHAADVGAASTAAGDAALSDDPGAGLCGHRASGQAESGGDTATEAGGISAAASISGRRGTSGLGELRQGHDRDSAAGFVLLRNDPFVFAGVVLEFSFDQRMESFLRGHVRAFADLGGVPRVILYDNLRSADYNVSIAAWVGMIALMGLDAETGVFMLLFLDLSYAEAKAEGRLRSLSDLHEAIVHGAVKRVRPKLMTVAAAMMGLMPIMWSVGTGADVMKRVAAPMVGGLATSFLMELLVYPAIYLLWKWHTEVKGESLQA